MIDNADRHIKRSDLSRVSALVLGGLLMVSTTAADAPAGAKLAAPAWPQWGGPTRDFKVVPGELADKWSDDGPPRLWRRPLGEGYSAIVVDADTLYTMYSRDGQEVVIALRADTGVTVWEYAYPAPVYPEQSLSYGRGPNATPLLLDGRLYTVGFTGLLYCLDAATGRVMWKCDLVDELGGAPQYYGFSNSPLAYDSKIIALVGGPECGVAALDAADGAVAWKTPYYEISHAAPILINVDAQDQIVFFTTNEVVGIDARGGERLWSSTVADFCKTNCTAALWGPDNLLVASTKGAGGTRVLKLSRDGEKTNVEQIWIDRKIRIYHWNAIRVGDFVYTSIGDKGDFLATFNVKTGEVVERLRGYELTNGVLAGDKLILLDGAGRLLLTHPTAKGLEIISSARILESRTWTAPTLAGARLYVRDRESILALDLH